jgi:small-conductance mechanosensitive channel
MILSMEIFLRWALLGLIIIVLAAIMTLGNLLRPSTWIDWRISKDSNNPTIKKIFGFSYRLAIIMPICIILAALLGFAITYWLGLWT